MSEIDKKLTAMGLFSADSTAATKHTSAATASDITSKSHLLPEHGMCVYVCVCMYICMYVVCIYEYTCDHWLIILLEKSKKIQQLEELEHEKQKTQDEQRLDEIDSKIVQLRSAPDVS